MTCKVVTKIIIVRYRTKRCIVIASIAEYNWLEFFFSKTDKQGIWSVPLLEIAKSLFCGNVEIVILRRHNDSSAEATLATCFAPGGRNLKHSADYHLYENFSPLYWKVLMTWFRRSEWCSGTSVDPLSGGGDQTKQFKPGSKRVVELH